MEKSFTNLKLKTVYRSSDDDLFNDFYLPVLSYSTRYDRAVGYFSSKILSCNIKGLSQLIKKNGQMRLIIGDPLDVDEYEAIKYASTEALTSQVDVYVEKLLNMIRDDNLSSNRLKLLGYLIASDKLEIKIALRRKGMYHEKIGIVYDDFDNKIVFQGSANETPSGLFEYINAECISIYKSWNDEIFNNYGKHYVNAFENLWNNNQKDTITLSVLSEQYKKIAEYIKSELVEKNDFIDLKNLIDKLDISIEEGLQEEEKLYPKVPSYLGSNEFSIRQHQRRALNRWKANQYTGILQHATGSGKTITALYALTKVFEAKYIKNEPLVVIISVPYIELATQWVKELAQFNIAPVCCYESKSKWTETLERRINLLKLSDLKFICILVVNHTLASTRFQETINQLDPANLMVIGDECHRHGAHSVRNALPEAHFRLGLSATPFHDDDEEFDSPFPNEAKDNILSYYQTIVDTYFLEDAINDNILTPYEYHIIPTYLTEEEQASFDELSEKISKIMINSNGKLSKEESNALMILSSQRSRILGAAKNKLEALNDITGKIPISLRNLSLFYVGEGKNSDENSIIDEVSKILNNNNWSAAQFTGSTKKDDRRDFLESFKSLRINALVAMKVLDEGIDVPACRTAYILASTKNPRQYIQRRGRVLRKYEGKHLANIYDFVILPCVGYKTIYAKSLKRSELERVRDFTHLASNKMDIEHMINSLEMSNE